MRFNSKHSHPLHSFFFACCDLFVCKSVRMVCNTHTYTHTRTKKLEIYIKYSKQIKGESFSVHKGAHFSIYLFKIYIELVETILSFFRPFLFPNHIFAYSFLFHPPAPSFSKFNFPYQLKVFESIFHFRPWIENGKCEEDREKMHNCGSLQMLDYCMVFFMRWKKNWNWIDFLLLREKSNETSLQ